MNLNVLKTTIPGDVFKNTNPYAVFRNKPGEPKVYAPDGASFIKVYPPTKWTKDSYNQYSPFTGIFVDKNDLVVSAVAGILHSTVGPAWYFIKPGTGWFYHHGKLITEVDFKRDYLMTHMREWDIEEWMRLWQTK